VHEDASAGGSAVISGVDTVLGAAGLRFERRGDVLQILGAK